MSRFQVPAKTGPEKKDITTNVGAGFVGAAANPTLTLLNGCQYGTGSNQHVGRSITLKSVYLRWSIQTITAGASAPPNTVRVIIVYDKETNGAIFASTDFLLANDATSPNNLTNSDRFIVLSDKVCRPDYQGTFEAGGISNHCSFRR